MKRIPFQTAAAITVMTVAASAAEKATDPTLADYRWHNDKVKFEKLSDKGLKYEQIAPKKPIQFGRPRPAIPFARSRMPGKAGSITQRKVTVNLLEQTGVARNATPITFGLPLPRSGLYDLASMRVLAPDGHEVSAQFTATAFWPDDSLKWVLVDFQAELGPKESANYAVELGSEVKRGKRDSQLSLNETDDAITVSTGAIKVVIDKQRFNILRSVRANGHQIAASAVEGVRLVDEHGSPFTLSGTRPKNVRTEEQGPEKVVVAVAGDYADAGGKTYMSYVTRLTFRNGSARVTVAHTHVNTYVKTEFTDITSLSMPLRLGGPVARSVAYWPRKGGKWQEMGVDLAARGRFSILQAHDNHICTVSGSGDATTGPSTSGRYPGVLRIEGADSAVNMVCHEFWQRWPKGFEVTPSDFRIELLPEQWGKQYGLDFPRYGMGSELPHWLLYPFVDGKYRFKWGMSFTTRVTFDFGGQTPLEELRSDANAPVVAVLPASWYAQTKAMGEMAAPVGKRMAQWDTYVAKAYEQDMARKALYREYGFFNYGDWYGERGRNWGNNEYDLAHGFFTQFVRTGRRDYFRLALAAARHQADVDCVHAYPDPFYVGANHPHAIGHTGTGSQGPVRATWSRRHEARGGIDHDFAGGGRSTATPGSTA